MGGETDGEILMFAILVKRMTLRIMQPQDFKVGTWVYRGWERSQRTEVEFFLTFFTGLFKVHFFEGLLRALVYGQQRVEINSVHL